MQPVGTLEISPLLKQHVKENSLQLDFYRRTRRQKLRVREDTEIIQHVLRSVSARLRARMQCMEIDNTFNKKFYKRKVSVDRQHV